MVRMKQRIQKILANAGVASRRNVEQMIRQGRISVNGRLVATLPILIDPQADRVEVDGQSVKLKGADFAPRIYFLLNKPPGVYSTNVAQGEQVRAIDLLPPNLPGRVYPVGRLDAASKGVLLLTNDGELTNQLTHPRYGVSKTYRAIVEGYVDARQLRVLEKGVWLPESHSGKGFKSGRSQIKIVRRTGTMTILEIALREGRDAAVRRMLARSGHRVRDLTRIRFGPLTLEGLAPGQFRPLLPREIRKLESLCRPGRQAQQSAKTINSSVPT
jgi:23S rRNA pseudouridine2605 synthase